MSEAVLEWRNYRYFPYEREFARLEVEKLFHTSPGEERSGLRISSSSFREDQADRLTYFAKVVHPNGNITVPQQARLEASAHAGERERQATRYSAHGLHEYKGKFNPQVVRALGNILNLTKGSLVLDPFCGSGTTLLEGAHIGWNVVGVDRNPLAVRIANAKVHALRQADGKLQTITEKIVEELHEPAEILSGSKHVSRTILIEKLGSYWHEELPSFDFLAAWFPLPVLAQIVAIRRTVKTRARKLADRAVFDVILSDLLREVSLQDPDDLRIRRRKTPAYSYPLIALFIEAISKRVQKIGRARATLDNIEGSQNALLGDIRSFDFRSHLGQSFQSFDAIITSPPYETALPYIDTHRLSLVLLGDIKASEIQQTEKSLIGAREISNKERREIEDEIRQNGSTTANLPHCVIDLCRELLNAAQFEGNGFRRRNRPALTYRYFQRMSETFHNIRPFLKPGATLALVVGRNRTVLGNREYEIDTPRFLARIAQHCGYSIIEERPMDTYHRYQMHSKNSIGAETLILLSSS